MKLRWTLVALLIAMRRPVRRLWRSFSAGSRHRWRCNRPQQFEIPPGQPLAATAGELEKRGWLDRPRWLVAYARLTGADARVRAGEYADHARHDAAPSARAVRVGQRRSAHGDVRRGLDVSRHAPRARARAAPRAPAGHAVGRGADAARWARRGRRPRVSFSRIPTFSARAPAISRCSSRPAAACAMNWRPPGRTATSDLPIATPYEALILASIVEKETALEDERPRIAGVFTTACAAACGCRPTRPSSTGSGRSSTATCAAPISSATARTTRTRARACRRRRLRCPGAEALRAAVRPDERGDIYFVATGLPRWQPHVLATLGEHEAAVSQYLARLRRQRGGTLNVRGRFITFEGGEGVGKTTQIAAHGRLAACDAASSSSSRASRAARRRPRRCARSCSRAHAEPMPPAAELLLMFAARATASREPDPAGARTRRMGAL